MNTPLTRVPWLPDLENGTVTTAEGLVLLSGHSPADAPCFDPETDEEYNAAIEEGEQVLQLAAAAPSLLTELEKAHAILSHLFEFYNFELLPETYKAVTEDSERRTALLAKLRGEA